MSAEENEAVVRRYIEEVWNRHNIEAIDELMSPDHFEHMAVPEHRRGIESARHVMNWLFAVFPDHRFDIEDAVADGDTVAVRGTCSGTHEGELWGIPPTGERFAVQQVHWFRVADGKVAEHRAVRDDLGMMRQLGVMPTQVKKRRNEREQSKNWTAQEVLDEHLKLSNEWKDEGEMWRNFSENLRRNFSEDCLVLTNRGIFRGHEGVRELVEMELAQMFGGELARGGSFRYINKVVEGRMGFLEWAYEDANVGIRGADSYLIEHGKIVAQTVHYTREEKRS